jgi:hypothetical protein
MDVMKLEATLFFVLTYILEYANYVIIQEITIP